MMALSWLLLTSNNQLLHSSSSRLSSPLQNFLNYHFTVHSLEVQGPNALFVDVVSCLHCSVAHFELNQENHSDLLFV